jgi:hypothetical protein
MSMPIVEVVNSVRGYRLAVVRKSADGESGSVTLVSGTSVFLKLVSVCT